MFQWKRSFAVFLIGALSMPAPAWCSWRVNVNPWRERRQDDVAAVLVAVQSVAPFDDYVASLQPTFPIDSAAALNQAIAQTRTQDTQESQTLAIRATARLPEIVSTSDDKTSLAADGTTTTTRTAERSKAPGDLSKVTPPDAFERKLGTPALPSTDTQLDPSLKYSAATALLQRIALLNNYVRDAAVRANTKPYLVRLLVTVLPSAATRGYDAYTTVSFFTTTRSADYQVIPPDQLLQMPQFARGQLTPGECVDCTPDELRRLVRQRALNQAVINGAGNAGNCDDQPLDVIPLLVTDTVSSSLNQDQFERARDLALALEGIASDARIGAGLRSQRDRIDKTLARSFNGLMTVSRVSQNSLEVRLGAATGNRDDALVPRTYDVTALVLFPTAKPVEDETGVRDDISRDVLPCSWATYSAQTTFRNSQNGKVARAASLSSLRERVTEIFAAEQIGSAVVDDAIRAAQRGDYGGFRNVVPNDATASLLWPRVTAAVGRHSFSRGTFQALPLEVAFFPTSASGTLFDDGKETALHLVGARGILGDRIIGTIKVTGERKKDDDKPGGPPAPPNPPPAEQFTIVLPVRGVDVVNDGREAILHFDAVSKYLTHVNDVSAQIDYVQGARDWESRRPEFFRWTGTKYNGLLTYIEPLKAAPQKNAPSRFAASAGARAILARDGQGIVTLALRRTDTKKHTDLPMLFAVDGADVVSATGATTFGSNAGRAADGTVQLALANLVPGTKVTIKSFSGDGDDRIDEPNIELAVLPLPAIPEAKPDK